MKITVLLGSPRKQDSYNICKEIEEQMNLHGDNIEFDYIFLNEYVIKPCKGCGLCFQKSENDCPCSDDDLNEIRKRLFSADGLIVATPVYAYQVTGQLKTFIDRMSYLFHRQVMIGIPALIVVTTDGGGSKQVCNYIKMTMSGWGLDNIGDVQVVSPFYFKNRKSQGAFNYDHSYYEKSNRKLKSISAKFLKCLETDDKKVPTFYDIFMFNCLRSKTYTSKADYAYWKQKGWLNTKYFYDVKLNPIKSLFGLAMKGFIHMAGQRYLKNE